jgi:hypothetical protein
LREVIAKIFKIGEKQFESVQELGRVQVAHGRHLDAHFRVDLVDYIPVVFVGDFENAFVRLFLFVQTDAEDIFVDVVLVRLTGRRQVQDVQGIQIEATENLVGCDV